MRLTTPVVIQPLNQRYSYRESILFVGSCFAQEIGRRMAERYFDVMVNPFGVLFNPASISECLGLLEGYGINPYGCRFVPEDVIETSSGYCSFHHHSSMARPTQDEFLANANSELERASDFYYRGGWVVVTLGTAFVYTNKENGDVVANCHKLPADRFERTLITPDQVYDMLSQYVASHPERQWIFTVSPVRHLADGLHANTISKSTLHLGVQRLVKRFDNVHYFPAYEILLDELRDYRFFADDMMHPSQLAADIILDRFIDWMLVDSDRPLLTQADRVRGMMQHRLLNPESAESKQFVLQRDAAMKELVDKLPHLSQQV